MLPYVTPSMAIAILNIYIYLSISTNHHGRSQTLVKRELNQLSYQYISSQFSSLVKTIRKNPCLDGFIGFHHALELQTPSETVFGVVCFGLLTPF